MRFDSDTLYLSARDLSKHLACRHVTSLDLRAASGMLERPSWYNALVVILQERGLQHEAAYLDYLSREGIAVLSGDTDRSVHEKLEWTRNAMRSGAPVIVQAALRGGTWHGYADVLVRVETPSSLGNWSYEVIDTKLARETRGGTILQLALYSELVGSLQGRLPERMHVVKPATGYVRESFRTRDYFAYFRFVKKRLEGAVKRGNETLAIPDPVEQCEICQWWPKCNDERRKADHLSFVAGISSLQMAELRRHDVETLTALGKMDLPFSFMPDRGAVESYVKVREQARVQLESKRAGKPQYEILKVEPDRGLARLPAPSPGDVFLDFEADPFVDPDGLEYLLGFVLGDAEYSASWAFDRKTEKKSFEAFVDMVMKRREQYPEMHVYHFSPYEPGALKRLMGKHASREDEIDRILRAGVLVDLHLVARQGLRIGIERYSLKELEPLHGFVCSTDLHEARTNLRRLEFALETADPGELDPDVLEVVESYNREDCVSTLHLRDWLETVRQSVVDSGDRIDRPVPESGDASEEVDAKRAAALNLAAGLLEGLPEDVREHSPEQHARWLLAQMMEWHRREDKASWWEYFRLCDLNDEQLLEEKDAVSGLTFLKHLGGTAKCPIHLYGFPSQDAQIRRGADLKTVDGVLGSIEQIDLEARTLAIKKTQAMASHHPSAAFVHDVIRPGELVDSLHRVAAWVIRNGIDAPGLYRSGRDLLLRHPPRIAGGLTSDARRLVLNLDAGVLPIQGPPGSGKTYTAARMICELVKQKKRVGVTAVGHKVIRKLLTEVVKAAEDERVSLQCIQKVKEKSEKPDPRISETLKNDPVLAALQSGEAQVAGGTGWLWARDEFLESVDVLFVDEAGQMSLADVIALSPGGKNLVLLGDPQQLEQPLQGTHPPGVAVSALEHVLGGKETMPPDAGLFLAETWRLAPSICDFTSELFYEGKLRSHPGLEQQRLAGSTGFAGAGFWFVPVEHEGNQNSSREEVERVSQIVSDLTREGVSWTDRHGATRQMTVEDILIVTPYNAQIFALSERLPKGAHIGTVDKFQGQEAPVVIYSMATSSPQDAPRGMEFLYSANRFNVATSRARCACILVANPRLFEPECQTPRQMKLANVLCRYAELANVT